MRIEVREADFADPSAGLRAGRADVALTRAPFDTSGLLTRELRADPVGVVLRTDDPLASREVLVLADLDDRRWFRLPDGTDEQWAAYWHGGRHRDGPVVRTVHECLQAVPFNGGIGLTSLGHRLVPGLVTVPLADEVARVLWDSPLWPLRGPTCCSMTAARSCRTPAGCGTGRLTGFQAEQYARYGPRPHGYPTG